MIRHGGPGLPLSIGTLAMPVSVFACLRLLIASVCRPQLLPPGYLTAWLAAVALTAITMAAHPEQSAATGTATLPGTK